MQPSRARATTAVRGGIARDERAVLFGGARRRRVAARLVLGVALVVVAGAAVLFAARPALAIQPPPDAGAGPAPVPLTDGPLGVPTTALPAIAWRASKAVGQPWHGRLSHGVQLPAEGPDWFTWDPVYNRQPNRSWRRWGSDRLITTLLVVIGQYRVANPGAARIGIGDLSRPHGGWFGREYGGLGHASHQNGLDADVWYPRKDGLERRARTVAQVDRVLAQDLVDRFRQAGAQKLFVGPHLGLRGPRAIVIPLVYHDDHVHVRIAPAEPRAVDPKG
jgi:Penicillin-insensitive murein endopeptidase